MLPLQQRMWDKEGCYSFTRKGKSDIEEGNITPPGIPPPLSSDDTAVEPEHPRGCLSTVATYMQWIISLQILCVGASFSSVVSILIGQRVLKSEHSAFDVLPHLLPPLALSAGLSPSLCTQSRLCSSMSSQSFLFGGL